MSIITKSKISKTVILLGVVSLFTDMASEMLYPVMPFYLESIGFSILGIGILEGIAQAVSGLSKGYFGRWSDLSSRRLVFVQFGYAISAISKPMMAFWANAYWVLTARVTDRVGKGLRTGARDALLSNEATPATRGKIFGFHRSMDTIGASLGPLIAIGFLWWYPESYKALFYLAFIPGLMAIIATLLIKESAGNIPLKQARPTLLSLLNYLTKSSRKYKKLVIGLLLFSLINSTDLFLLLFLSEIGIVDHHIIWIYVFYNLVFALTAYPMGILADKFGLKIIFIIGIVLFAVVYAGLSISEHFSWIVILLFAFYGFYAACTEGVAKAWISNRVEGKEVGSAIGSYEALFSITTMLASVLGGAIWYGFGAQIFFLGTGIGAVLIALFFMFEIDHVPNY